MIKKKKNLFAALHHRGGNIKLGGFRRLGHILVGAERGHPKLRRNQELQNKCVSNTLSTARAARQASYVNVDGKCDPASIPKQLSLPPSPTLSLFLDGPPRDTFFDNPFALWP